MTKIKLALLAAVTAFGGLLGSANAMPLDNSAALSRNLVQDVRVVCDQYGRCYESRRYARRIYRDYDDYAPRAYGYYGQPAYGYYGQPAYGYYGGGPSVGLSFGFGNRGWW